MPESNVLASLSVKARRAILRLSKIREKYDLTIDEAMIIVAVAECNFSRRSQALAVSAAPVLSIAEFLNAPYETTRRRMVRLRDRGLLAKVGLDGYMVTDLSMVRDLVDLLGAEAAAAVSDTLATERLSDTAVTPNPASRGWPDRPEDGRSTGNAG